MTTTALLTELEAINIILQAADEAPVSSLYLSGLYPLERAKGILSETSRVVQSLGWKFNTEDDFPLTRDSFGTITVPVNCARFDSDEYTDVDPVQRGQRMYDLMGHTYTWQRDIKGTAVFMLEWDELPQPARHYIAIRAAMTMQARSTVSEATYRYTAEDEAAARIALQDHETEVGDYNMLRDSWSVASVLRDRGMW